MPFTTLLDKATYSTLDIVGLYGQRWDVELDLRHIKTTLGMDVLRCKTPSMVRKEIYVYLLAYNLLRSLMWSAGTTYGTPPLRLSLQGTRHHFNNFIPELLATSSTKRHGTPQGKCEGAATATTAYYRHIVVNA